MNRYDLCWIVILNILQAVTLLAILWCMEGIKTIIR